MDTVQITKTLIAVLFYCKFGDSTNKTIGNVTIDPITTVKTLKLGCATQYKDQNFDINKVIGTWKLYYAWKVGYTVTNCVVMTMKNATPAITKRIYLETVDELTEQPKWDSAMLYATIGPSSAQAKQELLLMGDQRSIEKGTFVGVLNAIGDENISPEAAATIHFFITLLDEGRYLLMQDCAGAGGAAATLSAKTKPASKDEVQAVVDKLPALGPGKFTCYFVL